MYPCFIAGSGAYEPERVSIFYYRDKTLVQLFYLDSNTTVLLHKMKTLIRMFKDYYKNVVFMDCQMHYC